MSEDFVVRRHVRVRFSCFTMYGLLMRYSYLFFLVFLFSCCEARPPQPREKVPVRSVSTDSCSRPQTDSCSLLKAETVYTSRDSAEVVRLLRSDTGKNDVLFFARHFIGRPYVAHTLEVADPEKLVVNLRGLDCTTLVETVCALAMTKRQGSDKFADFCENLERLRYWGGRRDGYRSRLHYFTWWMHDNMDKGIVEEVSDPTHFIAPVEVRNNYMSSHADKYKILAAHPAWVSDIAALERKYNGPDGFYLPERLTNLSRQQLQCVEDGDIVAIVTTKAGLDYSHLGFAVWGKDGKLHLLNASMVYKKVVEDVVMLHDYLARYKTSVGIRLLRLR